VRRLPGAQPQGRPTDAEVIVFCGVHFMAETASILCPQKTVLLPRMDAGCLMADMITAEALQIKIDSLPPMPVVTYVNSTADVKALSTICCTSANVVQVVNSLDADEMLLTPDRNLAMYAASRTGKKIHVWEGYCPTHEWLTPEDVPRPSRASRSRVYRPPRVPPRDPAMADVIASTSGMLRHAAQSATRSSSSAPNRDCCTRCARPIPTSASTRHPKNDLQEHEEDLPGRCSSQPGKHAGEVKVPEEIRLPAFKAVERMLADQLGLRAKRRSFTATIKKPRHAMAAGGF
jgi:quinolinate synthase